MRGRLLSLLLPLAAGLAPTGALHAQEHHPPRRPPPARQDSAARPDTAAVPDHPMDHEAMMRPGPLGIPQTREGSGTAWLPDASPMYALHSLADRWELMLHGNAFLQYIDEGSDREMGRLGSLSQFGSINWFMGMARRPLAGGDARLRAMLSLEPLTVGRCGYPDLLATGEFCRGERLHDRQHPHDLFMELSASYDRAVGQNLGFQLYGGLVGEPALGPVSYPHRISALPNLFAPIGHHWQDATHIVFGVATAGLYTRRWKLEGSIFNGREPDEERFDFDFAPLDSYAARLWFLPGERWALQASLGWLNEVEPAFRDDPAADILRATASATHHRPLGRDGIWATTLVWGRNHERPEGRAARRATDALLLETNLTLDARNVLFGRFEVVEKEGKDLALEDPALEEEVSTVGKLGVGYTRQFGPFGRWVPAVGASLSLSVLPDDLEPFYDNTTPPGFTIFANVRPAPMMLPATAATR